MAIFSAVSTDSEPELVKNTWSSGRGASSLSRAASSNGSGEPIWKCGAKSMVAAWRAIASTMRGRAWPALQHHRPAVPSRIWRPPTSRQYMPSAAASRRGRRLNRWLAVNGLQESRADAGGGGPGPAWPGAGMASSRLMRRLRSDKRGRHPGRRGRSINSTLGPSLCQKIDRRGVPCKVSGNTPAPPAAEQTYADGHRRTPAAGTHGPWPQPARAGPSRGRHQQHDLADRAEQGQPLGQLAEEGAGWHPDLVGRLLHP